METPTAQKESGRVVKERPILFSGPMVRAILDGRKTQTRRIVKPQPEAVSFAWRWSNKTTRVQWGEKLSGNALARYCPYGVAGDRLWVREAWKVASNYDDFKPSEIPESVINDGIVRYLADGDTDLDGRYRHARFMPRWASRITLEITKVRVERLQEISEEDSSAEGIAYPTDTAKAAYRQVWDSINGKGAWDKNPWVWVISFRRLTCGFAIGNDNRCAVSVEAEGQTSGGNAAKEKE